MHNPLSPTLWRTCRVLANGTRLRILKTVLDRGPTCVKTIAAESRVSAVSATQHLRALQARGLLAASRQGRWVYYAAQADPAVEHAAPLLAAMRQALARGLAAPELVAALTAYTHPRRIAIVQCLGAGPVGVADLAGRIGASRMACYRHIAKLERRRIVTLLEAHECRLATPPSGLATVLLHEVLGHREQPMDGRRL